MQNNKNYKMLIVPNPINQSVFIQKNLLHEHEFSPRGLAKPLETRVCRSEGSCFKPISKESLTFLKLTSNPLSFDTVLNSGESISANENSEIRFSTNFTFSKDS